MQQFFMHRLRQNLRIVACCSPLNASLSAFAQRCPALLTKFTVDWVRPWPKAALVDYADAVLDSKLDLPHGLRDAVAPVQAILCGTAATPSTAKKAIPSESKTGSISDVDYPSSGAGAEERKEEDGPS